MNKEEFKAKANQTIDDVSAKINELESKKESAEQGAKSEYDEAIKDLKSKKSDLEAKYADLENASEDKWEEVKATFSSASDSFREGLTKISSLFS
jgi:DNA repair exonuclease SbcCD ATPase subunit